MQATGQKKSIPRSDRRDDRRFDCEGAISCSSFYTHDTFEGNMLNFSRNGMYFESGTIVEPGTPIYFRLTDCTVFPYDPESCKGLRSASLAEVRWCRELKNQGRPCFGIGVKYYKIWHFQFKNNHNVDNRRA